MPRLKTRSPVEQPALGDPHVGVLPKESGAAGVADRRGTVVEVQGDPSVKVTVGSEISRSPQSTPRTGGRCPVRWRYAVAAGVLRDDRRLGKQVVAVVAVVVGVHDDPGPAG